MKKLITLLIWAMIASGCDLFKPKPVNIDGLGSLSLIKDQQFSNEELLKIAKTVNQQKQVSDDDAQAMLEIYQLDANGRLLNVSRTTADQLGAMPQADSQRARKFSRT